MTDRQASIPTKRAYFCVLCGSVGDDENGLETCPGSELALSHLWAVEGCRKPWFKFVAAGVKAS